MNISTLGLGVALSMSQLNAKSSFLLPRFKQSYLLPKAPYGIAKSRRAAKKRNNIRKHK